MQMYWANPRKVSKKGKSTLSNISCFVHAALQK
uniref:Uncharacterized protein n=1 Tax=Arundo donax TaxID=35708 RepID=A0A0A9E4C7_ARUDO